MDDEVDKRDDQVDERTPPSESFDNDNTWFDPFENPEYIEKEQPIEELEKVTTETIKDIEKILSDLANIDLSGIKTLEAKNLIFNNLKYKRERDGIISLYFENEKVTTFRNGKYNYLQSFLRVRSRFTRFKTDIIDQIENLESGKKGEDLNSDTEDRNNDDTMSVDSLDFDFRNEWMDNKDFSSEFFKLVGDQIIENRKSSIKDTKLELEKDREILERISLEIRQKIEEVLSDNIEKHRKDLKKSGLDDEEVSSKLIEILDGYKKDVEFFENLVKANKRVEPIDLYKTILEIRREDVDLLKTLVEERLEDPRYYISRSRALQFLTRFKSFKDWFLRNAGPTLSIFVTVVSGVASVIVYVLEFLEENKKKIDDIRDKVKKLLEEVDQDHTKQNLAIENVDKDTFRKTLSHFVDTFFNGSKEVIDFVQKHIEFLTILGFLLILYEVHDRPSPKKIHSMIKNKVREKLTL